MLRQEGCVFVIDTSGINVGDRRLQHDCEVSAILDSACGSPTRLPTPSLDRTRAKDELVKQAGACELNASRTRHTARREVWHSPLDDAISSQAWERADMRKVTLG